MGETVHYAYLLATTRRDQYYLDVAPTMRAISHQINMLSGLREHGGEKPCLDPSLLVWHEVHTHQVKALARVAQIRAWPQRWQRRLIESENPYWLNQTALLDGCPPEWWYVIPETTPKTCPTWPWRPHGVPPEVVEQLKVRYGSWALPPDDMASARREARIRGADMNTGE